MMKSNIKVILFWAFLFRIVLLIYQYNIGNLPSAGSDSVMFENVAYQLSMNIYPLTLIESITSQNAYIHCFVGSFLYSIFGRVQEIWAFVHLIMGLFVVFNIYRSVLISTENVKISDRAAWIAALFPNLAIFSVILLREIYVHFFISFAILNLVKYMKYKKSYNLVLFFVTGLIGSLFHSAVFGVIFGFIAYLTLFNKSASMFSKVIIIALSLGFIAFVNFTGVGLSKFGGSFDSALDIAMNETSMNIDAGANYPNWLIVKGGVSGIVLMPIRMIAFFLSPLIPLMVRGAKHVIGILDAMFYLVIFYNIYKSWFYHKKSEVSKLLLIMTLACTVIFSFGSSNFGTNIRHRAKLLPVLLVVPIINNRERNILKNSNI